MKPYRTVLKIATFCFFVLCIPHITFADISQTTIDGSSQTYYSSGSQAQYLGTGLSGTVTEIDISYKTDTTYYTVEMNVGIEECDTYVTDCRIVTSTIGYGGWNGIRTLDVPDYTFNSSKHYTLSIVASGVPWGIGTYSFYGSMADLYPYGDFSSGNITDAYFVIRGVNREPGCTVNCNSSILFLPGVMGSRLFEESSACGILNDEKERWVSMSDCDEERLSLDENGKSLNSLYTKEGAVGTIDDVYNFNIYQSFMNSLNSWKNSENLMADYALVPYDWRLSLEDVLSNGTTTDGKVSFDTPQGFENSYVYKKLEELQRTSRTQKVTIVAHSNGGLVAKALIQKLKDTNNPLYNAIDNLILIAVPQTGTPDAVSALLHGVELGKGVVMSSERSRDLLKNMPSGYNLLPSSDYFSSVNTPIATFESGVATNDFINAYGSSIDNISELKNFLLGNEGRVAPAYNGTENPNKANSTLVSQAETVHSVLDSSWAPSNQTNVYQVAGWGEPTLSGIT